MIRLLYKLALITFYPIVFLREIFRVLKTGCLVKIKEQFFPLSPAPVDLWIHAVSGGEVMLAKTILNLISQVNIRVHITTQNSTGYSLLRKYYLNKHQVQFSYHPYDLPCLVNRFLNGLSPRRLFVVEHDLWPNMLAGCRKKGIRVILLNADFKPRDISRYRRFSWILPHIFNIDEIIPQHPHALETAQSLGLDRLAVIHSPANLKYLFPENISVKNKISLRRGNKRVVVLASTHFPEEKKLLDVLGDLPGVKFICMPRHPHRGSTLFREFRSRFRTCLYSFATPGEMAAANLVIVDTMGLSSSVYQAADLVLIGDSFRPSQGGHNFLEPLRFRKPVIYGPYLRTFSDITPLFEEKGAVVRCSLENLRGIAETLLISPKERRLRGEKGYRLLKKIDPRKQMLKKILFPDIRDVCIS